MSWSDEQLLDCAKQLTVSNLNSVEVCSYLQLQMKVRRLPPIMEKYLMQQIQCISLDQKPLRSESHGHSLVTDIAQENLQAKGIPVLLWSGLSACCSSNVGLLALVSEEWNRHTRSFQSRQGKLWCSRNRITKTVSHSLCSVVSICGFTISFLYTSPHTHPHPNCSPFAKTWLTHGFTDFKARRNDSEPLICVSGNQSSYCSKSMALARRLLLKLQPPVLWVCSDHLFWLKICIPFLFSIY